MIDEILTFFSLYDQVDTKFTFYNPNRTYSDVTRTWSMFVGNTTLLRTVNDTLSSSSSSFSSSSTSTGQLSMKRLSTYCSINNSIEQENLSSKPTIDEDVHYDEILLNPEDENLIKGEVN